MLRILLSVLAMSYTLVASAGFESCPEHFPGRSPEIVSLKVGALRELCFDGFAVLHSGQTRTPVLVIQRLSRERLEEASSQSRTDRFYEEARLPMRERASLNAYRGSGFDRGHLAAAAEMGTPAAMAQSFSLANVVPMVPEMNRGPWLEVERSTRKFVRRAQGDVYVYTGAHFAQGSERSIGWPWEAVRVPDAVFKLVYDAKSKRAWAYWMENAADARVSRPASYVDLVQRTGVTFLPVDAIR